MYGYIYKTTNIVTNKIYIGQKKSDIFLEEKYLGSGTRLHSSIKHYGEDKFKVELIEKCNSREELNDREIYWISYFNSTNSEIGYNLAKGGDGVSGVPAWNKGLTKDVDSRLTQSQQEKDKRAKSLHKAHQSGKFKYKEMFTEDVRNRMSMKAKLRTNRKATTKNTICFTDGYNNKMLLPDQFDEYIEKGWSKGKTVRNKKEPWNKGKKGSCKSSKKGKICINNGIRNTYINEKDFQLYKNKGWKKGMRPR